MSLWPPQDASGSRRRWGKVKHVIAFMPGSTDIERRDRALVVFTLMTGARGSALASMRLKPVDLAAGSVFQDVREVQTKFGKSFTTYFLNVGSDARQIVDAWVTYMLQEKLWGNDDPLFPATLVELREAMQFEAAGQNLGHEGVLTTFSSYGAVASRRQGQIIQTLAMGDGRPRGTPM